MFGHDFVEDSVFVADDFAAEMDIEVFERDGEEVGAMERTKKINAGTVFTRTTSAGRQGPIVVYAA